NQGLACRRRFAGWGWRGGDVAAVLAPGMDRRAMRTLGALKPGRDDVLLVHYSGYAPRLERLLDLPNPMVVISHNVTPARYFWAYEPIEGLRCALAPEQLGELARGARVAAGVSEFNAAELRSAGATDVRVIPILFERERLGAPAPRPPAAPPTILFVGRLAPHKRQDLAIRAFALYRRRHAPDARLVLVGTPLAPAFEASLRGLAEQVAPGAVSFERGLDDAALHDRYRAAHAFLCLSEHEGFCIPLLEAFHFGVPVVTRAAGGIAEVVGDAALVAPPEEDGQLDLAVVAELLHLAVSDAELQATLRHRAEARLDAFALGRSERDLRAAVEAAGAAA
ncbi:MAG TPA: glycosyltransferase family 4 protein, partial [Solirubrobacteraceae bacterium]|nr:glycosyltransferase family 4 protein [Solirubrobacteraceae bacterium]